MGARIRVNRHGTLTLVIHYRGNRWWESLAVPDSAENRAKAEKLALLVSAAIRRRTLPQDYRHWFPHGNRKEWLPTSRTTEIPVTVEEYYQTWIKRAASSLHRHSLARGYRTHFGAHILPAFGKTPLAAITTAALEQFRHQLAERLAPKSVRNIIDASFRALVRDAREVDELIEHDPFARLTWPRLPRRRREPIQLAEVAKILKWFRARRPVYHPFVLALFRTGMRPSEATALRWGDVDLRRGTIDVHGSRVFGRESAAKTEASERTLQGIDAELARVLADLKPLRVAPDDHVFLSPAGEPLRQERVYERQWLACLRALAERPVAMYATRHTFISMALSAGANPKWVSEYVGTDLATLERHYARYMHADGAEQLAKISKTVDLKGESQRFRGKKARSGKGERWVSNPSG